MINLKADLNGLINVTASNETDEWWILILNGIVKKHNLAFVTEYGVSTKWGIRKYETKEYAEMIVKYHQKYGEEATLMFIESLTSTAPEWQVVE